MTAEPHMYRGWTTKPKSIVLCRDALTALAGDIEAGRIGPSATVVALRTIVESMKRKPPISVAPKRIRPMPEADKHKCRAMHRAYPHMSQLELAKHFNTNPGRISEALNEFRT